VGLQRRANPLARAHGLFSSDIGHFDVPDMTEVVPEAYELVEHGLLDDDDFRDFMFAMPCVLGEVKPDLQRHRGSRSRRRKCRRDDHADYIPNPRQGCASRSMLYERAVGRKTPRFVTPGAVIIVTHTGHKTGAIRKLR